MPLLASAGASVGFLLWFLVFFYLLPWSFLGGRIITQFVSTFDCTNRHVVSLVQIIFHIEGSGLCIISNDAVLGKHLSISCCNWVHAIQLQIVGILVV